ncbi:hypothetical protein AXE80_10345 [Wenyingzhuangia fucanilytica]|uniref:TonB-dependent receptor plug domain-containing protein n=1 Tax=Wenyingzhuangia fucanilytica TaxID=1790137 RepID=A0A1B1Y7D8_9FLAO|nr:TonB-dependent receptor [Wenyingzhuangia fucanilytica]ANW96649.1 hypothetical protein AXE80_10345 [Wenyingzhuangia fucanilytica]
MLLLPTMLFAQAGGNVTGVVSDQTGLPIPGVTVLIKGSSRGTITDFDGNFTVKLESSKAVLEFSYIGYEVKNLEVKPGNTYKVLLEQSSEVLDEVVVIGYGSVDKKDITGAISSIKPSEDVVAQSQDIESVLRGRAAGVQVSANGAEPGASVSVRIRGLSSITGNSEPLYVVDGIVMGGVTDDTDDPLGGGTPPQGGLTGVNPADIESIEVLKDASATAIYGSRASNGVILITTKKGKKGDAKFTYLNTTSVGSVVRNIDVLDTNEYMEYQNQMRVNLGQSPAYTINPDGSAYTTGSEPTLVQGVDWAKDTYKMALIRRNRLTVSGGTDTGDYYISGGILSNQGTFPNAEAKATDFNLNLNQDLNSRLKIGVKLSGSYTELSANRGADDLGGANNSMVRQVILAAPILNLSDNNQDNEDVDQALDGPRAWTEEYDDLADETRLLGRVQADYKISDEFTYRLRVGADYRKKERRFWYGVGLRKGQQNNGIAGLSIMDRFRYNIDNTLMFRKAFNKNHKINGTVGFLMEGINTEKASYSSSNFADKSLRSDGISYGQSYNPYDVFKDDEKIYSFIGRLNYTLFNKYLFTGTFRADGSTKFLKPRFGYFPAFSFAWKAIQEEFLQDQDILSDLKVRLGYGEVGNQGIPSFLTNTYYDRTGSGISNAGDSQETAVVPINLANPDLLWENASQYNAGIDFGFFNDRLVGNVDVYYKNSSNLLIKAPIPPSTGFGSIVSNQGDLVTKGLEVSLSGDVINTKNTNWSIFGNIAFSRNRIEALGLEKSAFGALGDQIAFQGTRISGGNVFKQAANIFIEGRQAALFYGYATQGIIRDASQLTSPATGNPLEFKGNPLQVGDVYFIDQNGDGNIDDNDKTVIGNPNPEFSYGLGSTFEHKNFSASIMFNGVYGNEIANGNTMESAYANNTSKNVRREAYYDAFDPVTNPNGNYPRVGAGSGASYPDEFNDRNVEDGSFLRLSYVTLGYNLPVDDISFIDSAKLSVSGQNLYLWTNYSGFDPEVSSFAYDPTRSGVDWGSFPNQRTFMIGLNVGF